jgi:hypothetical protein
MHSSTAAASSGRILRTLSSALGSRCVKLSQASYRIAEGAVEPGRNIDIDEAASGAQKTDKEDRYVEPTRNFLYHVTNIWTYDSYAVRLGDRKCRAWVQKPRTVSKHTRPGQLV